MGYSKRTVTFKTVGDCPIYADVYQVPSGQAQPAILWLHGGGLIMGDRTMLPLDQLTRYLHAGFTVVAADYRLAPETKLAAILADVLDAFHWVRATGPDCLGVDPDRVAVVGHSAGAYLALLVACNLSPRPGALVSFYGYGDIAGDWYNKPDPYYCHQPLVSENEARKAVGGPALSGSSISDRYPFYLYCRQQGTWVREVVLDAQSGAFVALGPFCPIHSITSQYPPTFLVHGDQDTDVPYLQSVQVASAMARQGVQHELLVLPNRGHAFDAGPAARTDPVVSVVLDRVVAFLRSHLGGMG